MPADPDAIKAQFEALKAAFRQQLRPRLAELEEAWAAGDAAAAHRHAHKLAGTAGTFGVQEVSVEARALEHLLGPVREGAALTEALRAQVEEALARLRRSAGG